MSNAIDISQLSSAELEQLLAQRKKQEKLERESKKKEYEELRDSSVSYMVIMALDLANQMKQFKTECYQKFEGFRLAAMEYGDIRSHSKGGFSLRTSDGTMLARLERNVVHEYDERADLAMNLIREFLESTIKKKDIQTYRTIATLLERNKSGDLKPERVADLMKIKDNYDDERWTKAMNLLLESYREREVSYNVSFAIKDENGKDQSINLTFSTI